MEVNTYHVLSKEILKVKNECQDADVSYHLDKIVCTLIEMGDIFALQFTRINPSPGAIYMLYEELYESSELFLQLLQHLNMLILSLPIEYLKIVIVLVNKYFPGKLNSQTKE